jgi:hypothetical protein
MIILFWAIGYGLQNLLILLESRETFDSVLETMVTGLLSVVVL